jgi:hypothetical protein
MLTVGDNSMHNRTGIIVIVALAALIGLGIVGYLVGTGQDQRGTSPAPSDSTNSSQTTTPITQNNSPSSSSTTPSKTYDISVYFSKRPDSDDDPSKVFPVKRISPDLGVGTFAITELLKGPNETESANGYFSTANLRSGSVSNCGGKDFTLTISGGTATLKFCRVFDHRGVVADGQAESEIKATLKQFSSIQKVVILNAQNDCEFNLSGQNLCLQ